MNFRFFGMQAINTFACFHVLKNPDVDNEFERFDAHLDRLFVPVAAEV
jgi:modulator of drug activity B